MGIVAIILTLYCSIAFYAEFLIAQTPATNGPRLSKRAILGDNNLEPVDVIKGTHLYDAASAIARVETRDGFGICTSSRVGPRLFLTNYHCNLACSALQFTLGLERDIPASEQLIFRCAQLIHRNKALDYALYEAQPLQRENHASLATDYPALTLWNGPISADQSLILVGHPSGRFKEIDRSDACRLTSTELLLTASGRSTVKHGCDTEGGASGAPLLDNDTGFAVALHWGGRHNEYNMAIPLFLILEDLHKHVPETYAQLSIAD